MKKYLVGGAVRDTLLGLIPKDKDYVVVGSTEQEMLELGFSKVGADFPVFLHPDTNEEYALARSERKSGKGYNGFDVIFTPDVTLEQDLYRRDLTINSIAMDGEGIIYDPYNGLSDLQNKVLRHTSNAFVEDPVRVLRIARFAARYTDFKIHESTIELMKEIVNSGEFDSLTPERVFAEFKKGLMENKPSKMFSVLKEVGCQVKLKEFFDLPEGILGCLDEAAAINDLLEIRFAIISSGFITKEDYRKWTISSDCEEISSLLNSNFSSLVQYDQLSASEKIEFFNKTDFFRRPERFQKMVDAYFYICRNKENNFQIPKNLIWDLNKVQEINAGEIAAKTINKSEIKDAIFDARCKALL